MDKIIRGLLLDNAIYLTAIDGIELVKTAKEIHSLSRVCTAALGRALMQTVMMGTALKGENDRITTILAGGGMAGNIVCTAESGGIVKGYIENPSIELPLAPNGKLDVALAVGWFGDLTVVLDQGMKEPYIGRVKIESGEIAEDFARYFSISEQQPSIVYLGVRMKPESGEVISAGGLIAKPLPNCSPENEAKLSESIPMIQKLSQMLETLELDEALNLIFPDMDYKNIDECVPKFICDCGRERMERVLISMGRNELLSMIEEDGGAEIKCHFCNKTYNFTADELKKLLEEAESDR
ncbi:MAG: Hsp33 family molecular chaperone HslO [Clostridia bacterium]